MVDMEAERNERTIFLAFLTSDSFFYDKPYDKTSIMYLLTRFLGDLCGDIILLYDKKIEENFEEKNCPFTKKRTRAKGKI